MSARIYPDVCILLTLDFEQSALLRKCTLFKESIQKENITCYLLSSVNMVHQAIIDEVAEAGGNSIRGSLASPFNGKRRRSTLYFRKHSFDGKGPIENQIFFSRENHATKKRFGERSNTNTRSMGN